MPYVFTDDERQLLLSGLLALRRADVKSRAVLHELGCPAPDWDRAIHKLDDLLTRLNDPTKE